MNNNGYEDIKTLQSESANLFYKPMYLPTNFYYSDDDYDLNDEVDLSDSDQTESNYLNVNQGSPIKSSKKMESSPKDSKTINPRPVRFLFIFLMAIPKRRAGGFCLLKTKNTFISISSFFT